MTRTLVVILAGANGQQYEERFEVRDGEKWWGSDEQGILTAPEYLPDGKTRYHNFSPHYWVEFYVEEATDG